MDWKVDIYIKTDTKYLGNKKRGIGYVIGTMIGKELKTIEFFGSVEETLPGTYLTTINAALRRMTKPADIVIHAESPFVANMFTSYMAQWAAGGWESPTRNKKEWQELYAHSLRHHITIDTEPHVYSPYMLMHMKAREIK